MLGIEWGHLKVKGLLGFRDRVLIEGATRLHRILNMAHLGIVPKVLNTSRHIMIQIIIRVPL